MAGQTHHTDLNEALPLNSAVNGLLPLQRLELAHKLTTVVLQYYHTPWLPENWRLKDLSFFDDENSSAEDALVQKLQTLHLSTQFPNKENCRPAVESNCGFKASNSTAVSINPTIRYTYGIKNMTLARLGVALLEIGHKKDIGSFNLGQPHEVLNARVLADGIHTELGGRYQKMARKCIDCNFVSEDLEDIELQSAVYSEVLCELEDMMKSYQAFWGKDNFR